MRDPRAIDPDALDPLRIQDLLFRELAGLASQPRFQGEISRAEREFFGADRGADPAVGPNAARFSEWYLLERESEGLGEVPARVLAWPEDLADALLESQVGVYLVRAVGAGEISVKDLQDGTRLEVAPIQGADVRAAIRVGDLLIGRLYPDAMDRHVASCAMAVQHQADELAAAFQRDLRRLELPRRLSQAEIEHLMFRHRTGPEVRVPETPTERLEAELDSLLRSGGLGWSATAISQALAAAERPGLVADPILESVAFDSKLDITRVQRLLLELWAARRGDPQHPQRPAGNPGPAGSATPGVPPAGTAPASGSLGERLARRIEEGLEHNEDLEAVFAEVGEWIGEDLSEPEAGPVEAGPVEADVRLQGAAAGDLPALVREYCWETRQSPGGHDRMILHRLVQVQQNLPLPELDLERVTSRDLARLLLEVYLESAPRERAERVGAAFAVLDRFYRWCGEAQAMELEPVIHGCRQELVKQVPRLQEAGLALSAAADEIRLRPVVSRVASVDGAQVEVILEREPEPITLEDAGAAGQNLREGDILLGSLERQAGGRGSFVGMVVALPPIAADLIG